jgi:hypothetical protein
MQHLMIHRGGRGGGGEISRGAWFHAERGWSRGGGAPFGGRVSVPPPQDSLDCCFAYLTELWILSLSLGCVHYIKGSATRDLWSKMLFQVPLLQYLLDQSNTIKKFLDKNVIIREQTKIFSVSSVMCYVKVKFQCLICVIGNLNTNFVVIYLNIERRRGHHM